LVRVQPGELPTEVRPPSATMTTSVGDPVSGSLRATCARYAARVIPWIVFALVVVPLVVIAFVAVRRRTLAGERPALADAKARAETEREFAEAEAYEAEWREEDKERYHQERFP
jgi:hypothetical protein